MKKSKYAHVFFVEKGEEIDVDFFAPDDGYVWYDEVEQLGSRIIYDSASDAKYELDKYADYLNHFFGEIVEN